jgi:hypothetical protein
MFMLRGETHKWGEYAKSQGNSASGFGRSRVKNRQDEHSSALSTQHTDQRAIDQRESIVEWFRPERGAKGQDGKGGELTGGPVIVVWDAERWSFFSNFRT